MAIAEPTTDTRTVWQIDPVHTTVEFAVKHMMVSTVKGRFTKVQGTILADLNDLSTASIDVEIDATSIDTHNEQRDTHLRSADFLDAETFPSLSFKSTRVETFGEGDLKVYGDLTVRGVTRPVVLDAEFSGAGTNPWGARVAGASASTKISRKDFGLTWNVALETGGVLVGDDIKINLELEANPQASEQAA